MVGGKARSEYYREYHLAHRAERNAYARRRYHMLKAKQKQEPRPDNPNRRLWLWKLRGERSIEVMSGLLGYCPYSYRGTEAGRGNISNRMYKALSEFFGIPIRELKAKEAEYKEKRPRLAP